MDTAPESAPDTAPELPRRGGGRRALKILAIILLVLVLVCGGLVTYALLNAKKMVIAVVEGPLTEMVDRSDLPDAQKTQIKADMDRLVSALKSGELGIGQSLSVTRKLKEGGLPHLLMIELVRAEYRNRPGFDDAEREDAYLTCDRFQRAILEERLATADLERIMAQLKDEESGAEGKDHDPTDEELRSVVASMKEMVDTEGIPSEPYQVDFAAQFREAVDGVLGPAESPATQPADN